MGTVFPFQALADKESNDMASLQSTCSQSSHTLPTNNMMIIKNIADMEKKRLDSHWTCSSRTITLKIFHQTLLVWTTKDPPYLGFFLPLSFK